MLERGSKAFSCFLDVHKAFDTVWIDGLLNKLFLELGIRGRMWLAIRDLYTNVKAQVFYEGSLSRKIDVSQGTRQGRILAPFMYKVYVNGLLTVLSNHCYTLLINGLRVPSPSFADDISLLTLHPSFLKTFMNICNRYGIKWRYDFNHSKSGAVTFGETKPHHFKSLKNREWLLGDTKMEQLCEYKNFGVLKSYVGSFSSNIDDNIDKTRKKVGMLFSSSFDRRKVNPLIYAKFWRQACLPTLLYGAELFMLTPTLLLRLERCQSRFLKNMFYVLKFAPGPLLLALSCLNSVESGSASNVLADRGGGGGGGGEGRGEQRRGLGTKALMRDLGTRLECRQRAFVRTRQTLWKKSIVTQPDSNLPPSDQQVHDFPTAPSPHHGKIVDRCLCYYYHYM